MKLDSKDLRYLTAEDWRVLTAVEIGSKNHEVVPTPLITQISSLRSGSGVHKSISTLAKANLVSKVKNAKYDGYRLTYGGLDYLALHTHLKRSVIYSLGQRVGVGKESDIFICASPTTASTPSQKLILKVHRLGRISFRSVKSNRDYLRHRSSGSWMYMSRLAALKEFTFMKALHANGFSVPEPIAQNRHTIVMSLIDGYPLRQIVKVPDPAGLYGELIEIILRLARYGLIHGDFNEFNILIQEERLVAEFETEADDSEPQAHDPLVSLTPILIDFPQMVSVDHSNAEMYFDRDVNCVRRLFERRFHFTSDASGPTFSEARKQVGKGGARRLDVEVEASGFSKKMAKELEKYMQEAGVDVDGDGEGGERDRDMSQDSSDEDESDLEDHEKESPERATIEGSVDICALVSNSEEDSISFGAHQISIKNGT